MSHNYIELKFFRPVYWAQRTRGRR